MKLVIFLNTYTKMLDYNLDILSISDCIPVAIVLQEELNQFKYTYSKFFKEIIAIDSMSNSKNDIVNMIFELLTKYDISTNNTRLVCLSEDNMLLAGEVRDDLNIPGMKYAQSELFRDKTKMKTALKNTKVILPKFVELNTINKNNLHRSYESILKDLGSKFIIKPKSEFGALGVTIIYNYNDFVESVNNIDNLDSYEAETFIEGKLFHIDSVYLNNKPIFQVCCEYSFPTFDFQLGKPSLSVPLPDNSEITQQAKKLVTEVLSAFKYENGTSHLEFFMTNSQTLVFLEVAARTPGAITTPIYEKMFNFNMLNADLNIQLNLPVDQPIHNGKYVIRGIFPITKGKVEKVNIPSTIGKADIQWKVQQGDILDNCRSLRDISAKIMVSNDNYSSAYKDFKYLSNFGIISVCG